MKKREVQGGEAREETKKKNLNLFLKKKKNRPKKNTQPQIGIDQLDQNKAVNKKGSVIGAFKGAFWPLSLIVLSFPSLES